jgi:hypothetical protein
MTSSRRLPVLTAILVVAAFGIARADGTLEGHARFEKLKGRPAAGYAELYEWNAFLSAEGEAGVSQSYRCGFEAGGGSFSFVAAAGNHNIYISQPVFFARSKLLTGVRLRDGQTLTANPELDLDYSCYFLDDWTPWRNVWYQTFIATGTSINRISWRTAGSNATSLSASVLRDNGGKITTWPQVGPTKSAGVGWGDHYVGFRSGQIPTTPGQRYAIRLAGEGDAPHDFAPFARQEDGNGYADGQAYDERGNPADYDLNICVFSDNDGTVIPYCATRADLSELTDWCGACGQTFKATGTGLAACDLFFAGTKWALDARCSVRANGPGGPQVGRTKVGHGAWNAGGTGMLGVSWAPGEVPLTPGQTYYIEMIVVGGATGWNPYRFDPGADAYADGQAYISGGARDFDLDMTIMEYSAMPQPTINRSRATLSGSTRQGSSPADQTFTIANGGSGTLSYTVSDNATWLSVDPAGGAATTETDTITVSYSTADLPAGQHTATITISDPKATNNPQTIAVTLTVDAATPVGFYKAGWNLTSVPMVPANPEASAVFQDLVALRNAISNNYIATRQVRAMPSTPPASPTRPAGKAIGCT